jgi:hypothetical protein
MGVLQAFIDSFDPAKMKPDTSFVELPAGSEAVACALAEDGQQYALYLFGGAETNLALALPKGTYRAEWIDPLNGDVVRSTQVRHKDGLVQLDCPPYEQDIALRLVRE